MQARFFDENKIPVDFNLMPPSGSLKLRTIQDKCTQRIKYLVTLNASQTRKYDYEECLRHTETEFPDVYLMLSSHGSTFRELKSRYYNRVTFMILLLATVYKEDRCVVKWFRETEALFFRLRFSALPIKEQYAYLLANDVACHSLTLKDKALAESLHGSVAELFRVEWLYASSLISKRTVTLHNGFALIKRQHLSEIAVSIFRKQLKSFLARTQRELPRILQDARMKQLLLDLTALLERVISSRISNLDWNEVLPLQKLWSAVDDFPPCISRIYDRLKSVSHLRYEGRRQLILFLKSIGLNVDDAVELLRRNFTNVMSEDCFVKEKHAYFIRHLYGLEGSHINYSSYSCKKMLKTSENNSNDCNGCPLQMSLKAEAYLSHLTVNEKYVARKLITDNKPTSACSIICNSSNDTDAIESPLQFYIIRKKSRQREIDANSTDSD